MDAADSGSATGEPLPEDVTHRGQRLGLPEAGPGSMATFGRRVVALFIDWIAAMLISRALVGTPETTLERFATLGIFAVEVTILTWLWGSSFGQRIVGLRVVGRTRRLGFVAALLRTVLICIVIPPVIWDADGRGLHDRAVDSVVIRS